MAREYPELAEAFFRRADELIQRIHHPASIPETAEGAIEYVDNVAEFLGEQGVVSKYDWERLSDEIDRVASSRFGRNWYLESLKARVKRVRRPGR